VDLKIEDVAKLLNVSATTIRRWLTDGKIPAYRLNHQYRFSKTEIEDWVLSHKLSTGQTSPYNAQVKGIEKDPSGLTSGGSQQFSLYRALNRGGVLTRVAKNNKEDAIRHATGLIAKNLSLDSEALTELLLDRERTQATSLGNGIGIPHTRDFFLKNNQDSVSLVLLDKPIEYGALDRKPVHSMFFLFASNNKKHLHLLAKIAHLSSLPATLALLQQHPSKEDFLKYVKDWESSIQPVSD
jgi:PTS system nitrogen regulatory IIA component